MSSTDQLLDTIEPINNDRAEAMLRALERQAVSEAVANFDPDVAVLEHSRGRFYDGRPERRLACVHDVAKGKRCPKCQVMDHMLRRRSS